MKRWLLAGTLALAAGARGLPLTCHRPPCHRRPARRPLTFRRRCHRSTAGAESIRLQSGLWLWHPVIGSMRLIPAARRETSASTVFSLARRWAPTFRPPKPISTAPLWTARNPARSAVSARSARPRISGFRHYAHGWVMRLIAHPVLRHGRRRARRCCCGPKRQFPAHHQRRLDGRCRPGSRVYREPDRTHRISLFEIGKQHLHQPRGVRQRPRPPWRHLKSERHGEILHQHDSRQRQTSRGRPRLQIPLT
jgi:hypothetical protein